MKAYYNQIVIFLTLMLLLTLSGCSDVKPWEKRALAQPHMAFEPDAAETHYRHKVYKAKEGSAGGYGVGGGGCGCN